MEMTGFPYSEEGAITSIALGPLSSERWEPFLLVLSFTRIREKKKKEGRRKRKKTHTHTKPQPLSGVVEGGPVSRQRSLPQPCADGQTGSVCTKGKTLDSSSGFEKSRQGNTWRSPWTLWDAIPWPRSHLAEVTSSTLGGPREQQEGPVPGPSAKLALFLYTPVKWKEI